jgi:hypothetical protein
MKKLIKSALALGLVAMTFSSCEDVPAPFDYNYTDPSTEETIAPDGDGTEISPYNVARTLEIINAGTYTSDKVYVKGIVTKIDNIDTSYGNATYFLGDTKTSKNTLEVYRGKYYNGDKFTTGNEIAVGDTIVLLGVMKNFGGTLEIDTGSEIISINGKKSDSGTVAIDGTTVTAVNAGVTAGTTTVTLDLNTLGLENAVDATTYTLSDGSTITFGAGSNPTNSPKFYTATKGVRLYANNTITFAGKAKIAKIIFTCDSYNGTDYVGNSTATITFDGNNATYINAYSANSGGVQLRVQTVTIVYAQ